MFIYCSSTHIHFSCLSTTHPSIHPLTHMSTTPSIHPSIRLFYPSSLSHLPHFFISYVSPIPCPTLCICHLVLLMDELETHSGKDKARNARSLWQPRFLPLSSLAELLHRLETQGQKPAQRVWPGKWWICSLFSASSQWPTAAQ